VFHSVSEVLDWQRCRRCHYCKYVLRLPEDLFSSYSTELDDEPSATGFGTAAHAAIARWRGLGTSDDLCEVLAEELHAQDIEPDPESDTFRRLLGCILAFFKSDLWHDISASSPVWEKPIVLRHGDANFRGKVDLHAVADDVLTVVDFKSAEVDAASAPRLARHYVLQLGVYARALQAVYRTKRVRTAVYFLHPSTAVEFDAQSVKVVSSLDAFLAAQAMPASLAEPEHSCLGCAFRKICRS